MSDRTYDTIKIIALLAMPIITLVITLLNIFGVINSEIAPLISTAFNVCLGGIVMQAKKIYDEKKAKEVIELEAPENEKEV